MTSPIDVSIPFKFSYIFSSAFNRLGFDYNPAVMGSMFYNSENLQGFLIDGQPAPEELEMNNEEAEWNLFTGSMGTAMRRNVKVGLSNKYFDVTEYLRDDENTEDPPEDFPGYFGHSCQVWDLANLPRGDYKLEMSFFILPNFSPGDQFEYLKIVDQSLEVKTKKVVRSDLQRERRQ